MDLNNIFSRLAELSGQPLFKIAETEVTLFSILLFLAIIAATYIISSIIQRALNRSLASKFTSKPGALAAILRLIHYTVLVVGFGIALPTVGISLATLFAAGAIFAIAIGFAMQNIVQNFVSGIILLTERSITPGDIIEVEGGLVKVVEMRIRTTVVRTRRDEELIIPNSIFAQSTVKNYTLNDNKFRIRVEVGVTYGSDMVKVKEVLEKTVREIPWQSKAAEPSVRLMDFGQSAVIFWVSLMVNDPWRQRTFMSELREAIWFAFKEADIVIAFNQLDVHLDPPVSDAIASLRKVV